MNNKSIIGIIFVIGMLFVGTNMAYAVHDAVEVLYFGGLNDIHDITTDYNDRIIVVDGDSKIKIFNSTGHPELEIIDDDFNYLVDVATNTDNDIFVLNRTDAIVNSDTLASIIIYKENGNYFFNYPTVSPTINAISAFYTNIYKPLVAQDNFIDVEPNTNEPPPGIHNGYAIINGATNELKTRLFVNSPANVTSLVNLADPVSLALNFKNEILVLDGTTGTIFTYTPDGNFLYTFETGISGANNIATDTKDRIIVSNSNEIFGFTYTGHVILEEEEEEENKKNGGCADCTPPTFGKDKNHVQLVENGFTYNGVSVDVTDYHTEFPLITVVTDETNTVTLKVYENQGVNNIKLVQFGMGMPEVGAPLGSAQTLVEVWFDNGIIDEIIKIDKNNLVDIINATTSTVDCASSGPAQCLEVTLQYVYRDQPKYNVMAINAMDSPRNSQTNYLNDGILVIGESLNEPLEQDVTVAKGGALYPQRAGTVLLTLIDYKTDMWQDEYGYMWSSNEYGPYLVDNIPVPQKEPDAYSQWSGYNDRKHSEFAKYKELQIEKAMKIIDEMKY